MSAKILFGEERLVEVVNIGVAPHKVVAVALITRIHEASSTGDDGEEEHDYFAYSEAEARTCHKPVRQTVGLSQFFHLLFHAQLP